MDRRESLLVAAARVFAERGFDAASIEEITSVAGVAKGSFYREFTSKDHVALALKERFVDELGRRTAAIVSRLGAEDIWDLTDEFLAMVVDLHLEHRDLASVLAREAPVEGFDSRAHTDRLAEMIAVGIRVGTATGAFKVDDPETVAKILMNGIQGLLHQSLMHGEDIDRDRILAAARHIVRGSLSA
jgi:AcrR family transcriptional regulator